MTASPTVVGSYGSETFGGAALKLYSYSYGGGTGYAQAGDVLLVQLNALYNSGTFTLPSGWSTLNTSASAVLAWHLVAEGDPDFWEFGTSNNLATGTLSIVRGADPYQPFATVGRGLVGTGPTASTGGLDDSLVGTGSLMFGFWFINNGQSSQPSPPSGWTTSTWEADGSSHNGCLAAYTATPATGSGVGPFAITLAGSYAYNGYLLIIRPAWLPGQQPIKAGQLLSGTGTSLSFASVSNELAPGQAVVATVAWNGVPASLSSPPSGWRLVESYQPQTGLQVNVYVATVPTATGTVPVLSLSWSNSLSYVGVVSPVSGAAGIDQVAAANVASGTSVPVASATASAGNESAMLVVVGSTSETPTVPTGYSITASYAPGLGVFHAFDPAIIASGGTPATGNVTVGSAETLYVITILLSSGDQPPSAPTLGPPANNAYEDVTVTDTFDWAFNGAPGGSQAAWAFRQKLSGAGSYSYWNAGTSSWQSTIVWNTGTVTDYTFPAGAFTDGNTYQWSVATQGQGPTGANQSAFPSDFTLNAQQLPTVTISAPTGVEANAQPIVAWATSPASGDSQTAYQVIVEHGTYGTAPGSGTQDYNSGVTSGTAQSLALPVTLANGTTYRVFVQATQTGGLTSAWAYSTFTVTFDAPAMPSITATAGTDPTTGAPLVTLAVTGHDNLLSAADSTVESGLGGWVAATHTAISRTSAYGAVDGSWALELQNNSGSSNAIGAATASGTSAYPVEPSTVYTAWAAFKAAATDRSCSVQVTWYTSAGAVISTQTAATVTDTTSGWAVASGQLTSPSNAAYAAVILSIASTANNEIHAADTFGIFPGVATVWTGGGFAGNGTVVITRSDGAVVRGASVANPLALPGPSQQASVNDYEPVPGVSYTYSAVVYDTNGGQTVSSPAGISGAVTSSPTGAWVFDCANIAGAQQQALIASFPATARPVSGSAIPLLGNPANAVVLDVFQLRTGTLTLITLDETSAENLAALLAQPGHVFCLIRPALAGAPTGLVLYFSTSGTVTEGKATEALLGGGGGSVLRNTRERMVSVPFTEQNRPAV